MHASSSSPLFGILLFPSARPTTKLQRPTSIKYTATTHNATIVYDTAQDAPRHTTSNQLRSPSLALTNQDLHRRRPNHRSLQRRQIQVNLQITLQELRDQITLTKPSGTNDQGWTTRQIRMQTQIPSHGYQKHRYHSTATSAVRGGTLRHFSHPMPPFRVTSTDRPGDFSTKSTSQASQKHTVPKATRKQLAFPTTASFSGHTALRDGKQEWD